MKKSPLARDAIDNFSLIPFMRFFQYFFVQFLIALPPHFTALMGTIIFLIIGLGTKRVRYAVVNLSYFYPHLTKRQKVWIAWQTLINFGQSSMEFFRFSAMSDSDIAQKIHRIDGYHHVHHALATQKPLIFVSSHCGSFGALAMVMRVITKCPVGIFIHRTPSDTLNHLKVTLGARCGYCSTVNTIGGTRSMIRLAKSGVPLIMLVDGYHKEGIDGTFFGYPTKVINGHLRIAQRVKANIIPVSVRRTYDVYGFEVKFSHPLDITDDFTSPSQAIDEINHTLEKWIRETPLEWNWFHRRWPDLIFKDHHS